MTTARIKTLTAACIACVPALTTYPVLAQVACEQDKITASDGALTDRFGIAVAMEGDTTVVGANQHQDNGASSGAAYVYRFDGRSWIEEQKLLPADGAAGDNFGICLAIGNSTIVVGANNGDGADQDTGSAYVFRFDGRQWIEEQKLVASDGSSGDGFGLCVDISGDSIVVGSSAESAYIFRFDGRSWNEEQKLVADDGVEGELFGGHVAVANDVAIVGANRNEVNGFLSGAAYVFRYDPKKSEWLQEQKLFPADGGVKNSFAGSMSVVGDVAVIASHSDDDNGPDSGSAYVFRFDGRQWIEEQKLLPSDGFEGDLFGSWVSLFGDVVGIGANSDDDSGSAYMFSFNAGEWQEVKKLVATDAAPDDLFGRAVAVSENWVAVGAPGDDGFTGSAYWFLSQPEPDCNRNGVSDDCDVQVGNSPDINGNGIPDECEQAMGDLNLDGVVGSGDLLILLGMWGECVNCEACIADLDGDCIVGTSDLLILLGNWG